MTEIRLYNTATRQKEVLRPLEPGHVRMYVCGPTVYDRAHIGNARPVVVFDVLFRLLRHVYGESGVTYVRNFTDVDDKINKRAAETRAEGETTLEAIRRITDQTIGWYRQDMAALGALPPTHEPRATDYVNNPAEAVDMVRMIQALIDKGCAYEAEGHVLFHVPAWERYGALSRRPLDEMEAGARVDVAPYKRSPLDFVLWKPSDDTLPGWDSPWGRGRPGWHIECSAMAKALLGERFDIHGGGIDLQFPHHENELAQSCCANGTDSMASIWMHNGFLQVEGEKMAKSLGNFFTVKDLLDRGIPGEVIRFVLLSGHYRQPLDWTEERVEEAETVLRRWRGFAPSEPEGAPHAAIVTALMDDLNTPAAIAELHRLYREGDAHSFSQGARLLGLLEPALGTWASKDAILHELTGSKELENLINDLTFKREAARKNKDFERADQLRDLLRDAGVELRDTPKGPEWELTKDFDPAKLEAAR